MARTALRMPPGPATVVVVVEELFLIDERALQSSFERAATRFCSGAAIAPVRGLLNAATAFNERLSTAEPPEPPYEQVLRCRKACKARFGVRRSRLRFVSDERRAVGVARIDNPQLRRGQTGSFHQGAAPT